MGVRLLSILCCFLCAHAMEKNEQSPDSFDFARVHALCATHPSANTHEFHVLAQQVARTYKTIVDRAIADQTHDPAPTLANFLHACPSVLVPYINCYFYLFLSNQKITCQCADFKQLVNQHNPTFVDSLTKLPDNKDMTLYHACMNPDPLYDNYIIYLLALGADPEQSVRIKHSCKCCYESEFVSDFVDIPVIRFCKSTAVKKAYQRLREMRKKQTYE